MAGSFGFAEPCLAAGQHLERHSVPAEEHFVVSAAAHSTVEARHLEQKCSGHLDEHHSSAAGLPPALLPAPIELSALFGLRLLAAASSLLGAEEQ